MFTQILENMIKNNTFNFNFVSFPDRIFPARESPQKHEVT